MPTIVSSLAQAVKQCVFYLHFTIFKAQVITTFKYNYYDAFSCVTTARHIASVYSLYNRSYT